MNTNNHKALWINRLFFILTILWMIVIFIFSHQTGEESANFSGSITEAIVKFIFRDFELYSPSKQLSILETTSYIIRKGAHFTEYAILGFFSLLTLYTHKLIKITNYDKQKSLKQLKTNALYAFIFSAVYSISDEIHQYFIPFRHAAIFDVCIDSSGALLSILFTSAIIYMFYIKKKAELL